MTLYFIFFPEDTFSFTFSKFGTYHLTVLLYMQQKDNLSIIQNM